MDADRCAQLGKRDAFVDKGFLKAFSGFSLGLVENFDDPIRLYIMECKGPRGEQVWYVGMVHFSEMRSRFKKHFQGESIHYTKVFPAQKVVYLCTAPTAAGEAYLYYEMLRRMPANMAWKLGGFIQTSSKPSRLDCLLAEQARRGMHELCFNCGADRFKGEHLKLRKCPYALRGVEYECPQDGCPGKLLVTSRGHAEKVPDPPKQAILAEPVALPSNVKAAPTKRLATPSSASVQPVRKARKTTTTTSQSSGEQIRICGVMYTALSWFLEQRNPSKKQCAHATLCCHEGAVELEGAHVRALSGTAFAKAPPAYPTPLCLVRDGSERHRLGNEAVDTEIAGLKVQRADGKLTKRLSQVLFRVDVLQHAFSSC